MYIYIYKVPKENILTAFPVCQQQPPSISVTTPHDQSNLRKVLLTCY
jgi:hypothetical protein